MIFPLAARPGIYGFDTMERADSYVLCLAPEPRAGVSHAGTGPFATMML